MYAPSGGPWWAGNVYGNVFVIPIVAVLGFIWSRSHWWPLRPIHSALRGLHEKADETHRKLDEHAALHAEHAESLNALHVKLDRLLDPRRGKAVE
jgi:hypothetical protein